jgi:HK97 family phage major capsid protein
MSKMLDNLREARNSAAVAASEILGAAEVTTEALEAAEARHAEIVDLDSKIATAEALEARTAAITEARVESGVKTFGSAVVTREAMTYDKGSDNSFVRDMIFAHTRNDRGSWDRLHRHMEEVAVETRDVSRTDTTSAGEFVPPLWLVDSFAPLARAGVVGAGLVTEMALPGGTDSINIPKISTGTQAGFQASDNGSTANRDLVSSTVSAPVRTISGYDDVAIQLVDQSPLGIGIDRLIFGDLTADVNLQLNTAVVGNGDGTSGTIQGLYNAAGNSITWTETTPSGAGGQAAIAKALAQIAKNRYADAEAIVMHASTWYYAASLVDSQNRPLIVPTANGVMNGTGVVTNAGAAQGLVGTLLGIPVYVDSTMPTVNTNQFPILVGKFSDSFLFTSGLRTRVLNDAKSSTLGVRFQVYQYAALAHRYPASISKITGTGVAVQTGF